jgi:glycerol-3-phosphate dehydrogenase
VDLVPSRADSLAALGERTFDVLVAGGGIVGAGTAAAAAYHGLSVALVDRGDFAGATSSSSSKLIHGGLRYLRLGDVRLVREAHDERRALMRVVAPHLVHQIPFLMPLYEHGPYRPYVVQTGIAIYSTLARARLNGLVDPSRAARMVPELRLEGLRKCGLYVDCWTNDSRLTLANVRATAERGGVVANYATVAELRVERGKVAGATVVADGRSIEVRARTVVNASGPWLDSIRRLEDPSAAPSIRLSKGVHVLLDPGAGWSAALTVPHDKVRVSFAVPWQGMLLLGTTDELYEGDPGALAVEEADVAQVLAEAAVALDPELVGRGRVRATYAGVRVLPGGSGGTTSARRETVYTRGKAGMLSVAGGKLTTYRRIALDALGELRAELGLHRLDVRPWPLPGAEGLERLSVPVEISPTLRSHLRGLYGSLTAEVLAPAVEDRSLLEPLASGAPDIAAQVLYAARAEWATGAEDVLRRRTVLALRGVADDAVTRKVEGLLGVRRPVGTPHPDG